jgi:hypothetical protein
MHCCHILVWKPEPAEDQPGSFVYGVVSAMPVSEARVLEADGNAPHELFDR